MQYISRQPQGAVASVNPVITRMFVCSYVCSTGTLRVPAKVINMMTSVQGRQIPRGDPHGRVAHCIIVLFYNKGLVYILHLPELNLHIYQYLQYIYSPLPQSLMSK